jgi:hypothetical protein
MNRKARLFVEFIVESMGAENVFEADIKRRPRLSQDSVDDQIDSILLKYESDCIVSVGGETIMNAMGESYEHLFEAPGDEDEPEPKKLELGNPDEDEADEVASQVADKDDEEPDEEADPLQPKIDLKMFAGKVSRLATNYDALLDMPIAIVNRAMNYLRQNYGEALANEFSEVMERDFGIELEHEDPSEPREPPMAIGAAAQGLGGG